MKHPLRLALAALAAAAAVPVVGVTLPGSFAVSAHVPATCKIVSTNALAFADYDPVASGAAVDQTTTLRLQCTKGTSYTIGLDAGLNSGSAPAGATRAMSDGAGNFLGYELYKEVARTNVWGASGALAVTNTAASTNPVDETIYGRIPAGQLPAQGTYGDTINLTVTF